MNLNYNRDRKRVEYFERSAKSSAGVTSKVAENGGVIPANVAAAAGGDGRRRKVKVPMVEGSEFSGQLELIVQGDEVFIVSGF